MSLFITGTDNLRSLGVALISAPGVNDDIAAATNADILTKILNVPLLSELRENLTEPPLTDDA